MRLIIGLIGLLLSAATFSASAQDVYRLQANDRIEIWTSVDASLRRTAAIGPDGWLSLPLVGHMKADGMTTQELESALHERLKGFFKESIDLTVMLQPTEERAQTIYVIGDVTNPGAYPYRPGSILLQGVSMAGGIRRGGGSEGSDEERLVTIRGQASRDSVRLEASSAAIERIAAEISGKDLPPASAVPSGAMERERQILAARRTASSSLLKAHNEAVALRRRSSDVLREQVATLDRRIEISEQRMGSIRKLVSGGYANEAQLLELEGDIAELRGNRLEVDGQVIAADIEIAAETARYEAAVQERQSQLEVELRDTQREAEALRSQIVEHERVLQLLAPNASEIVEAPVRPVQYSIIRTVGGKSEELAANEYASIEPGDLIRVSFGSAESPAHAVGTPTSSINNPANDDLALQ